MLHDLLISVKLLYFLLFCYTARETVIGCPIKVLVSFTIAWDNILNDKVQSLLVLLVILVSGIFLEIYPNNVYTIDMELW